MYAAVFSRHGTATNDAAANGDFLRVRSSTAAATCRHAAPGQDRRNTGRRTCTDRSIRALESTRADICSTVGPRCHRRRNRGGEGHGPPTFSLQGPCCFSPPPQLEPKIKPLGLQHIHKPHVTFYMRKLYLMAAPSLMFHFLDSFRRSLLLESRFSARNSPNTFLAKALPQTP